MSEQVRTLILPVSDVSILIQDTVDQYLPVIDAVEVIRVVLDQFCHGLSLRDWLQSYIVQTEVVNQLATRFEELIYSQIYRGFGLISPGYRYSFEMNEWNIRIQETRTVFRY